MRLRRLLVVSVLGLFGAVPAAFALAADPFGPPEIADRDWRPGTNYDGRRSFAGADGLGDVVLGTIYRDPAGKDQVAVYDRCGGASASGWTRTVVSAAPTGAAPMGVRVARNGTAIAVWRVTSGATQSFFSSTRPPGGTWAAPQLIVADPDVLSVVFAVSDAGDAVAAWADVSPAGISASVRPAGGTWGAPETMTTAVNDVRVAMSAAGDALVAYRGPTPGYVFARHRSAGGSWGAAAEVLRNGYQNTLKGLMVEFDGAGRALALANFREVGDVIRVNVRGAGGSGTWGPTDAGILDDDGANPPDPYFDVRILQSLARHPQGAVAVWTRRSTSTNFDDDIVVSRLSAGGWEQPAQVFDAPTHFDDAAVATNDAGEILLVGTVTYRPGAQDVTEVRGSLAPSLTAAWPAMGLLSPQATVADQYRDAFAVGGGTTFTAGWGVHGTGNQRTEAVSTKPPCAAPPAAVPTPVATASPPPSPPPSPAPAPAATPTPVPTAPGTTSPAAGDFVTLRPGCVRGRKLTIRFRKPPKGYAVKHITVKVDRRTAATLPARRLKRPLYLRRLPRRPFTLTVAITLTKGKGLTERRRYSPCR